MKAIFFYAEGNKKTKQPNFIFMAGAIGRLKFKILLGNKTQRTANWCQKRNRVITFLL